MENRVFVKESILVVAEMLLWGGCASGKCCSVSRPVAGQLMVVKRSHRCPFSFAWVERGSQSMPVGQCDFRPVDVGNELVDLAESDTVQPVDAFLAEDDWSVLYEAGRA
jgi:hypothetical protein